ncbi:MAG: RNA pseudouridine synthase [Bacilli bacterium]|nr:RNA pseudouridine synthase [Bacilli bacterium]
MKDFNYYVDNLNVLYEDNHIIVIEKEKDVLSQKDETDDFSINEIVKEYLKRKYNKPGAVYLGLVHRLDRRVSGVMVLAKTSKAATRLSKSIMEHEFEKKYLAYVEGIIDKDGSINIKILKKDNKAIISDLGKEAKLNYKVINNDSNNTYVMVDLESGRYNQIRLSFTSIGHPIYGDLKYGAKIKSDDMGLASYQISFSHPVSKEYMTFKMLPKASIWKDIKLEK